MLIDEFCSETGLKRINVARAFGCPQSTVGYYARNEGAMWKQGKMWKLENKSGEVVRECHENKFPGPHRLNNES